METNQNGFALTAIAVIAAVMVLVGAGFFVYQAQIASETVGSDQLAGSRQNLIVRDQNHGKEAEEAKEMKEEMRPENKIAIDEDINQAASTTVAVELKIPSPQIYENIQSAVPTGWKIIAQSKGDLNGDHADDAALFIEEECDKKVFVCARRLVVLLKNSDNKYDLALTSDKAADHPYYPVVPDDYLEIKNGMLLITYNSGNSFGAYSHTYYFVYLEGEFYLAKKYSESFIPRATINLSEYCPDNAFIFYKNDDYINGTSEKFIGPLVDEAHSSYGSYICQAGDKNKKGVKEYSSFAKSELIDLKDFDWRIH